LVKQLPIVKVVKHLFSQTLQRAFEINYIELHNHSNSAKP